MLKNSEQQEVMRKNGGTRNVSKNNFFGPFSFFSRLINYFHHFNLLNLFEAKRSRYYLNVLLRRCRLQRAFYGPSLPGGNSIRAPIVCPSDVRHVFLSVQRSVHVQRAFSLTADDYVNLKRWLWNDASNVQFVRHTRLESSVAKRF